MGGCLACGLSGTLAAAWDQEMVMVEVHEGRETFCGKGSILTHPPRDFDISTSSAAAAHGISKPTEFGAKQRIAISIVRSHASSLPLPTAISL